MPELLQFPLRVILFFLVCEIVPFEPIVILPETVKLLFTDPRVSVDTFVPAPIVSDLHEELAVTDGWFAPVKFASPIITSTVEVGTPDVQFEAVPQEVLVIPFHEVWEKTKSGVSSETRRNIFDAFFMTVPD